VSCQSSEAFINITSKTLWSSRGVGSLVLQPSHAAIIMLLSVSDSDVPRHLRILMIYTAHGIHFKSRRYGDLPAWKPEKCENRLTLTLENALIILPLSFQVCNSVTEAADQLYSYVVITTKAIPELVRTPALLSPLLSPPYSDKFPQPTYVLFQNGLNIEVDLYNALKKLGKGKPKIISSVIYVRTNMSGNNVVEHDNEVHIIWL
jgi:hypothetical protein